MSNNINWGWVSGNAEIMTPGEVAGDGRCTAGQFGLPVEDVIVYGTIAGLRQWLTSALNALPAERHGVPLVEVDLDQQASWLASDAPLYEDEYDEPWTANGETVADLFNAIADDPAAAGWRLGHGVKELWSEFDEYTNGLTVGVVLTDGLHIGIGEPLSDKDLTPKKQTDDRTNAATALALVAARINNSY